MFPVPNKLEFFSKATWQHSKQHVTLSTNTSGQHSNTTCQSVCLPATSSTTLTLRNISIKSVCKIFEQFASKDLNYNLLNSYVFKPAPFMFDWSMLQSKRWWQHVVCYVALNLCQFLLLKPPIAKHLTLMFWELLVLFLST